MDNSNSLPLGSAAAPAKERTTSSRIRSIFSGSVGNMVEWYDWYVYAAFSLYFAKTFFPKGDTTAQLLNTAAIFAVGFPPIARRPYCRECGTPLGFEYPDAERCDLTVGSFDDPSRFVPTSHFGAESMHAAWLDTKDLPTHRCNEYASLVDRWKAVGLDVPE